MVPRSSPLLVLSICAVLLILFTLAAGCYSQGSSAPPAAGATPAPSAGNAITIRNFAFSPGTLTVKAGTTVTWTNEDGTSHDIVSDAGAPVAFSSPVLATHGTFPFTFTQPGTYPYHCGIHPSMTGTIIVQA